MKEASVEVASVVRTQSAFRTRLDAAGCRALQRGDIVCNLGSGISYVVEREATDMRPAVGIRTIEICGGSEWELVREVPGVTGACSCRQPRAAHEWQP